MGPPQSVSLPPVSSPVDPVVSELRIPFLQTDHELAEEQRGDTTISR